MYGHHKMKYNCCRGSFSVFMSELFIWFFVEESVAKRFIDGCVFAGFWQFDAGSYGGLQEKSFNLSNFSLFMFFHCRHKMQLLSRFFSYSVGLFIWFFGWGKRRHGIQRKWMLKRQGLTAEYREGFWPHLRALRSCIQGLVSVSNNCSFSLDSVLLQSRA